MRPFCVALSLLCAFCASPALSQTQLFLSPTGTDTSLCQSPAVACKTMQYAVDHVPYGAVVDILLADGIYSGTVNVFYWRMVNFSGNCEHPENIIINNPAAGEAAFAGQDHAILTVSCITSRSSQLHTTGILGRQQAIIDYDRVHFGEMPSGVHFALSERATGSCVGPYWVDGSASFHTSVHRSDANLGCTVTVAKGLTFDSYFVADFRSSIDARNATFLGPGAGAGTRGRKWTATDSSLLIGRAVLPGDLDGQTSDGASVR
jgi:hypothetical protein